MNSTDLHYSTFIGAICRRSATSGFSLGVDYGDNKSSWIKKNYRATAFVREQQTSCSLFRWDTMAILIRGPVRIRDSHNLLNLERIAEEIRFTYLDRGELLVDNLDGSFTVLLCDLQACRLLLYRNLIGTGFTYYYSNSDYFICGGNLAELVAKSSIRRKLNQSSLASLFLYRCVPGRDTLLDGFQRLLPGEQICWDERGLTRWQRHTFSQMTGHPIPQKDSLDAIDEVMTQVLRDHATYRPDAVNLLSGGVDSSYIQAIWNKKVYPRNESPHSYSISVDHPYTWGDTDYAVTASRILGSDHHLVPANGIYYNYLETSIQQTGEPLNHVQSAYFGILANQLRQMGISSGICGEGADSLFGISTANQIHNALFLKTFIPIGCSGRSLASKCLSFLRCSRLAYSFLLADRITDEKWDLHPTNLVAAFTDLPAVRACFGSAAIEAATLERRRLLDRLDVGTDPLQRIHAIGLLAEAMDSAGLWATLFQTQGVDLLCPFLDSRMIRLALNLPTSVRFPFRQPKAALRKALARHTSAELANRAKLGFGQPIFEWLSRDGQLHAQVKTLNRHPFVDPGTFKRLIAHPTWFLYSLLLYDTWHKHFIESSIPTSSSTTSALAKKVGSYSEG